MVRVQAIEEGAALAEVLAREEAAARSESEPRRDGDEPKTDDDEPNPDDRGTKRERDHATAKPSDDDA